MDINLKPVQAEDHALYSKLLIGAAQCPVCTVNNVRVFNPHGDKGNPSENYFEEHRESLDNKTCDASRIPFGELETLYV